MFKKLLEFFFGKPAPVVDVPYKVEPPVEVVPESIAPTATPVEVVAKKPKKPRTPKVEVAQPVVADAPKKRGRKPKVVQPAPEPVKPTKKPRKKKE